MKREKRRRLEAKGWKFGDYADFVGLSPAEKDAVEKRLSRRGRTRRIVIRPFDDVLRLSARIVRERAGGYSCFVPGLPGCVSQGDTLREARAMITDAAEGYLVGIAGIPRSVMLDSFALHDGRTVRRRDRKPIYVWFEENRRPRCFDAWSREYGVDLTVRRLEDLHGAVGEWLANSWTEYAECPSSKLTAGARRLKRRLRELLEVVED